MTSLAVKAYPGPAHWRMYLYVGPDADHRAYAGSLVMRPDEAEHWLNVMSAGGASISVVDRPAVEGRATGVGETSDNRPTTHPGEGER